MNDFPKEEFISRIEKIQIYIEKKNIDAVIITSPSNFRYFTGLDSNFWESPTRPWYVFISCTSGARWGLPCLVVVRCGKKLV